MEKIELKKGETLFRQGDPSNGLMYEIIWGKVGVYGEQDDHQQLLTELGSRDSFGELALLNDGPRTATVIALEKTQLRPVDVQGMREYFHQRPGKLYGMMEKISGRIRDLSKDYVKASEVMDIYTTLRQAGSDISPELNAAMKEIIGKGKKGRR